MRGALSDQNSKFVMVAIRYRYNIILKIQHIFLGAGVGVRFRRGSGGAGPPSFCEFVFEHEAQTKSLVFFK